MPIDYKRYPPNWKKEIVPAVIKRAGNCCEQCGLENGQKVFAIQIQIKEGNRYKIRRVWFRDRRDAEREARYDWSVREIKVVLTVAHLDHDEENHQVTLDRLAAWCQVCHLRYDAVEKYRRQIKKWKAA